MYGNVINFWGVMMQLQRFDDGLIVLCPARNGYLKEILDLNEIFKSMLQV